MPNPSLTSIAAHLYVRDLPTSIHFFTIQLAFTLDFTYGDPPFYAQVSRDNARLALRQTDAPVFAPTPTRIQEPDLLSASITVATAPEIELLFHTFQAAAVPFHQPLRTEPWGAQTFIVHDPDQNLILFAGPAA